MRIVDGPMQVIEPAVGISPEGGWSPIDQRRMEFLDMAYPDEEHMWGLSPAELGAVYVGLGAVVLASIGDFLAPQRRFVPKNLKRLFAWIELGSDDEVARREGPIIGKAVRTSRHRFARALGDSVPFDRLLDYNRNLEQAE